MTDTFGLCIDATQGALRTLPVSMSRRHGVM
jgi:hypothetical protein